jgi:hypothetical protein
VASGFLILPDGRCFARRWSFHDAVLRAVADELPASEAAELRGWLLGLLPSPVDEEHVGYGPWYRVADDRLVERMLDLRELAPGNHRLICEAVTRAAKRGATGYPDGLVHCLSDLADMVSRFEHGEPPLSRSDWVEVVPQRGRKIGPGWTDA